MKFFSKLKAKKTHLISAAVLASSVGLSFAAVTLPATFTSGTLAKASDMNANFQAINNGLPSFLGNSIQTPYGTAYTLTTTAQNLTSIAVTVPTTGTAVITASGTVCGNASTNSTIQITVDGAVPPNVNPQNLQTTATTGVCAPFSTTGVVPGLSAGNHTIAVQGTVNVANAGSAIYTSLSAILYH